MRTRIVFGALLIAAVAGLFWLEWTLAYAWPAGPEGLPLGLAALGLVTLGVVEFARFARLAGAPVLPASAWAIAAVAGTAPVWGQVLPVPWNGPGCLASAVGLALLGVFGEQMLHRRAEGALTRAATTVLCAAYLGVGTALILAIRTRFGVGALVWFLASVKLMDIGAYFAGSFWGRHKMVPWLSPGKSWEGLAGGTVTSCLAGLGVGALMLPGSAWWQAGLAGGVAGLVGQLADLCESLLKRSAGVKDSAALIPRFGGVLDLMDSPLLAAPAAYLLLEAIL